MTTHHTSATTIKQLKILSRLGSPFCNFLVNSIKQYTYSSSVLWFNPAGANQHTVLHSLPLPPSPSLPSGMEERIGEKKKNKTSKVEVTGQEKLLNEIEKRRRILLMTIYVYIYI